MITCRDIAVAAAAVLLILSLIGRAEQKEAVQGSTVFDWNSIPAKPTESGSVRLFFKGLPRSLIIWTFTSLLSIPAKPRTPS
jgi:hypothetical protein